MPYTLQQAVLGSVRFPRTYGSAVPAGTLLVVTFSIFSDTETITRVWDQLNGDWAFAAGGVGAVGERAYVYYCHNSAAGVPVVDVEKSGPAGTRATIYALTPAGDPALNPLRAADEISGIGADPPSILLAGVPSAATVIGQIVATNEPVTGAGYTAGGAGAANYYQANQYDLDAGASGDKTVNWTWAGPPGAWNIAAASFVSASIGASGDLSANESGIDALAVEGSVGSNGIRLTLRDTDTGAMAASLSGLIVSARANSADGTVLYSTDSGATNAGGVYEFASSALGNIGDYVYVTVEKLDHSIVATYRVQVIDLNA
jgi:hypothetical protein